MKQNPNSAKNAITRNLVASRAQIFIGYIVAVNCGLIGIIGGSTTGLASSIDVIMVTLFLVLMVLGILQIVRGKKRKKLISIFKDYAARLAQDPLRSIDKLAASTGTAVVKAKKNILHMIHKGYFVNAYIDYDRNCLVFSQESSLYEQKSNKQADSSMEYICVTCLGCGAKNKVQKGTVGECEFCGNYL